MPARAPCVLRVKLFSFILFSLLLPVSSADSAHTTPNYAADALALKRQRNGNPAAAAEAGMEAGGSAKHSSKDPDMTYFIIKPMV